MKTIRVYQTVIETGDAVSLKGGSDKWIIVTYGGIDFNGNRDVTIEHPKTGIIISADISNLRPYKGSK